MDAPSIGSAGLVGRDAELAVAHEMVAAARVGASATMLVEGEAGIGKTHFVRSVMADARDAGASVVQGAAHAFERNRPFGVVADALDLRPRSHDRRRAAVGRLLASDATVDREATPAPRADARFRIVDEIVHLVDEMCSEGPTLVVLEDLHWADDSSLAAIHALVQELNHLPLVLLGTMRPAPRTPELDLLIDESVSLGARHVRLRELAPTEVDALVESQLGAAAGPVLASIIRRASGNPLLVVELLRSLSSEGWLRREGDAVEAAGDDLPGTLRELVLRRLRYLPASALDVLQLAAVLGESVSVQDLATVSARSPRDVVADLSEAFRARLLDERDDRVVFRHQLVQQAIYEDLPAAARRALHRDAATALARSGADLSKVATHLLRGAEHGDLEAVGWLRRAAAQAAAGSPATAVTLIRHAGDLLPSGHDDADVVHAELAAALMRSGQVAEATRVAEEVLARPHRADIDVPLQLTIVDTLSLQNRTTELIARAEAVLALPGLQPADRAFVLTQASYGRTFSGDVVGGEATARRALELAEQAASTAMTVWSLCAGSVPVKTQGRYSEALTMAQRALRLAFEPIDHEARLRHPHFFVAMALADSDEFDEARRAYAQAIDEAAELGAGWLLPDMLALAAEVRFLVGDWDDAWTELDAAMQLGQQHGQRISIPQSRAYQALIALARGDRSAASDRLAGLAFVPAAGTPYGTEMVAFATAAIAESDGDLARGFELLHQAWSHDVERDIRYYHRYLGPALVRLGTAVGRHDIATEVVASTETAAALAPEVPTVQAAARRCRGLLEADPEAMVQAVELARRASRVLDLAGTCEDAASVLAVAGDRERAKELLVEAQAQYERLDAAGHVSRVAAALRALGVRQGARGARPRAAHGWESLTTSERTVCQLVAEGLTNREVARRLHVSPHTVNTHLRHVFRKLDVANRAELAAQVARNPSIHAFE